MEFALCYEAFLIDTAANVYRVAENGVVLFP